VHRQPRPQNAVGWTRSLRSLPMLKTLGGYRKSSIMRSLCTVVLTVLLLSCADPIPVPPDKIEYVGLWVASDRFISIFSNGRLEYKEKLRFGMHNRTESNFQFRGNTIESDMFVSFDVQMPPNKRSGKWKMQLDGVLYERIGAPITYGKSNNWPEGVK